MFLYYICIFSIKNQLPGNKSHLHGHAIFKNNDFRASAEYYDAILTLL